MHTLVDPDVDVGVAVGSGTCTHPGCPDPASTSQLDHLVPHGQGGATNDGVWITEHPDGTRITPPD